jgi:hypothetical protein
MWKIFIEKLIENLRGIAMNFLQPRILCPAANRAAMARCGRFFSSFENVLLVSTIVSVITGVAIGFALRPLQLAEETQRLINFPGEIFMRVLKMMILPLIFSSLISGLRGRQNFAWNFYYLLRIRGMTDMSFSSRANGCS